MTDSATEVQLKGRVAHLSLRDLTIDAIVKNVLEKAHMSLYSTAYSEQQRWEQIISLASEIIAQIESGLPQELLKLFVKRLSLLSPLVGFIFACKLSSKHSKLYYQRWYEIERPGNFPVPMLVLLLSNLAEGLSSVTLEGIILSDRSFEALSLAPAAKTIKLLNLTGSSISDSSAHIWRRFESLEDLVITQCRHLDIASFEAIAKLPTLQSLIFLQGVSTRRLPSIFLSRDALPLLRALSIDMSSYPVLDVLDEILALLQEREGTERLLRLELMFYLEGSPEEMAIVEKICKLCPNLEKLFFRCLSRSAPFNPELEIVKSLQHLQCINGSTFIEVKPEQVPQLPKSFPELTYVSLRGCTLRNWDAFTCVTNLTLISDEFVPIERYPPKLAHLYLSCPWPNGMEEVAASVVDRFYETIADDLKQLKELTLILPFATQRHHILLILGNLLNLQRISINKLSRNVALGPNEPIEVSHPRLIDFPDLSDCGFHIVPLWLPRVTSLSGSRTKLLLDYMNPVRMPMLSSVSFEASPATWPKIGEILQKFKDRMMELCIVGLPQEYLWIHQNPVANISHLSSLTIAQGNIPQGVAKTILSHSPLLHTFSAFVSTDSFDLSWLRHSHLSKITLKLNQTAPFPPTHHSVAISRDALPMLTNFSLTISDTKEMSSMELRLHDVGLHDFRFTGGQSTPVDLHFENCPYLQYMELSRFVLRAINLISLPMLTNLLFDTMDIAANPKIGSIECPRIRELSVDANASQKTEWQMLKRSVEDQAAHRPHAKFSLSFRTL